ncbi:MULTISPECIES: Z1 domain-containing protein [unclassified Pseudomonas]|uniref:Z1 domain-containing protein n=1 Tax=unclassified Pseudomonas TaxID=196821 RepID=UPI00215BD59F|nr:MULTISPECIES: Z1 domain-containing protein [unclassified Pseudomonas]MCR8935235.1 Z1 domain-containing protein [Pseudomonas sp. S11A4]MCR8973498.1 Z1 domain-containing protein [Pseudomonas sp. S11P7]
MTNPQVETFARQIREKLPTHDSPQQAAEALKKDLTSIGFSFTSEMDLNLVIALEQVIASLEDVEILRRSSLIKKRDPWYKGPNSRDVHWPALKGYLTNSKGWDENTIASIDESSSEVVSLLANPNNEGFRHRGLVVGYVQSGKTANMTAVIAKAVDAGYNLIVLLGGVTNKLRAQTQRRIENDIVNRHRHFWQLYTTEQNDGDYTYPANGSFTMPVPGRAQLVVMKKITSRLETFRKTIIDDKGKPKTPLAILRQLKVLLIDDECDQASVNSSNNDYDMTRINAEIRKIIRALPAVSYVGYTATPFANVFIDPYPLNPNDLDDLYPEDFITTLPRTDGYFGAREVFGYAPANPDGPESPEEAGRNMIRHVPDEKLNLLQPARTSEKDSFYPQMTEELQKAVLWFLLSCAIRRARGQQDQHMTMLVHTSPYIIQHERMAKLIENWIKENLDELTSDSGELQNTLEHVFNEETIQVPLEYDGINSLADLRPHLKKTLAVLEYAIENGESFERLDYTQEPKTYIVVGGTVLARGLTLEGLSVSFFLRTSMQYDTLLQMGRWFGYRKGYEDLPRLWTTAELASNFRALARIEEEIRDDISNYRKHGVTPKEFAVRVRAIPGMAITAASKMRHAYRSNISFEGRHVQTIRFDHQSVTKVTSNWEAAVQFVDEVATKYSFQTQTGAKRHLAKNVKLQEVRRFLVAYDICEHHMDLKKDLLLGYIDQAADSLQEWNVGIITPTGDQTAENPLGMLGYVNAACRSQLKDNERGYADIKALMSKSDILIDATDIEKVTNKGTWADIKNGRPQVPLLLLYVIDGNSKAQSTSRRDLDAVGDLIGLGIVFPGAPDQAGDYFSVELDAPVPEQIASEEELLAEALDGAVDD